MTIVAILILAIGTYAMRLVGPLLNDRFTMSENAQWLMALAATVLLCSLAAISTLTSGEHFSGWARVAGVVVGGILAIRNAPFMAVVFAAAATTACLRLFGVD